MEPNSSRGIQPGGITILVIFTVLCLAIFSVLSLGTVRADARLSQKYADLTQSYYAADARAEAWLAETDAALRVMALSGAGEDDYWAAVQARYGDDFDPSLRLLWFETPVSENQALSICLALSFSDTPVSQVVSHRMVTTAEIPFDDSLSLWDGGEEMNLAALPGQNASG